MLSSGPWDDAWGSGSVVQSGNGLAVLVGGSGSDGVCIGKEGKGGSGPEAASWVEGRKAR